MGLITVGGFTFEQDYEFSYTVRSLEDSGLSLEFAYKWIGHNALYLVVQDPNFDYIESEVIMDDFDKYPEMFLLNSLDYFFHNEVDCNFPVAESKAKSFLFDITESRPMSPLYEQVIRNHRKVYTIQCAELPTVGVKLLGAYVDGEKIEDPDSYDDLLFLALEGDYIAPSVIKTMADLMKHSGENFGNAQRPNIFRYSPTDDTPYHIEFTSEVTWQDYEMRITEVK
jgi:hypothetical protein